MTEITAHDIVTAVRKAPWVMLTTTRPDGALVSHPMVAQEVTDACDIWFFISLSADQTEALRQAPAVNIAVAQAGTWVSVSGVLSFVDDSAKIAELWNDRAAEWFEGGLADPDLGLIHVKSESAQYWGTEGGRIRSLVELVKSRMGGHRPEGSSETFSL
ncbi:pyridoxamine 5'-phosphate oxidase family protein [Brevibacterium sp. 50QC2O2]|uniref:pyridoxamine 5'-phosphate oxidase family protein n=1 Tax=Brevibacterium TaxID=1696 RepID=UPI00211BD267|nr:MULTISPECIES: pyridoxamine 5'-phosphate oxidase family protein [unclassified Brevibacterium]MCQ9369507.1 pyridoxamine 5'-phosphate oxidase family protein [Brevibacterium sp. 91QC2O2]MCQ9386693.1 pyridoxamine 5'-phosphate oxidase family protein [Brevibacterium sp. 68QC2CO]MCQ9389353.1 pyridoxamine 5'-phosphate oxidase family protein [Brevibacterium sp. 50QC2O2]